MSLPIPIPDQPIHIRTGVLSDLPFMDGLQKKYGKALGYFPRKQFEGYIEAGEVLIAEKQIDGSPRRHGDTERRSDDGRASVTPCLGGEALGYLISKDRYLKRDELGVIFQLCVAPGAQRGFIGASLLRTAFERSAYGCRLYCCWCAQDLEANYFWEAMGFVPLAFRVGSQRKRKGGRVHIFWQKKIVAGDTETKWWYPFQTSGGALRADRVVLPIPEGVSWRDVQPIEIPTKTDDVKPVTDQRSTQPLPAPRRSGSDAPAKAKANGPGPGKVGILVGGRIKYVDRPGWTAPAVPEPVPTSTALLPSPQAPQITSMQPHEPPDPEPPKPKRPRKPVREVDAGFLRIARELRDRWLEQVNTGTGREGMWLESAKYDVRKMLTETDNGDRDNDNDGDDERRSLPGARRAVKCLPAA